MNKEKIIAIPKSNIRIEVKDDFNGFNVIVFNRKTHQIFSNTRYWKEGFSK